MKYPKRETITIEEVDHLIDSILLDKQAELALYDGNIAKKDFQVGDKIKLIKDPRLPGLTLNNIYVINEIPSNQNGHIRFFDDNNVQNGFTISYFELYERHIELEINNKKIKI